ncbi:hypothetical protein GC169_03805 [bacterium]|nr:hypothetical protein [bacterium]
MSTGRHILAVLAGALSACDAPSLVEPIAAPVCEVSGSDLDWLDRSLAAVREAASSISVDIDLDRTEVFVFDDDCLIQIATDGTRQFVAHDGMVPLPIGAQPAAIMSFAAPTPDSSLAYFVMALPSVWEAAGFTSEIALHDFTLGVFAHEISHVWQLPTYYGAIRQVPGVERLLAPVNDDMVQRLFEGDAAFRSGIEAEIEAFRQAARESDPEAVRRLAREARSRMQDRWTANFTGDLPALSGVQAIFLTLEGSGQWFAIEALTRSPSGPRLETGLALEAFGARGAKWSQDLGLALTGVLDRLDPDWPAAVYGAGDETVLELLDATLEAR